MVKSMFKGSTIEIWDKAYINKEPCMYIAEEDKNAEIIQMEHAYDHYFMVEVVRRDENGRIILQKEDKKVLVEEDLYE